MTTKNLIQTKLNTFIHQPHLELIEPNYGQNPITLQNKKVDTKLIFKSKSKKNSSQQVILK